MAMWVRHVNMCAIFLGFAQDIIFGFEKIFSLAYIYIYLQSGVAFFNYVLFDKYVSWFVAFDYSRDL